MMINHCFTKVSIQILKGQLSSLFAETGMVEKIVVEDLLLHFEIVSFDKIKSPKTYDSFLFS